MGAGSHPLRRPTVLGSLQSWLDDTGDARSNLVLKMEHVLKRAVEVVSPEMGAVKGIDQLCGDAYPLPSFAHRAFEDIADAEFAPHLLHVDRLALVREGRVASDDEQRRITRQGSDDLLDHAVGEIFLLRVATQIGEGQYRDRRLVG